MDCIYTFSFCFNRFNLESKLNKLFIIFDITHNTIIQTKLFINFFIRENLEKVFAIFLDNCALTSMRPLHSLNNCLENLFRCPFFFAWSVNYHKYWNVYWIDWQIVQIKLIHKGKCLITILQSYIVIKFNFYVKSW